jgi:hypothetical protein
MDIDLYVLNFMALLVFFAFNLSFFRVYCRFVQGFMVDWRIDLQLCWNFKCWSYYNDFDVWSESFITWKIIKATCLFYNHENILIFSKCIRYEWCEDTSH